MKKKGISEPKWIWFGVYKAEIKKRVNNSIICHNCKKTMRHNKFYVGGWVDWLVCSPKCFKILNDESKKEYLKNVGKPLKMKGVTSKPQKICEAIRI